MKSINTQHILNSRIALVLSSAFLIALSFGLVFFNSKGLKDAYLIASYQICPIDPETSSTFSLSSELSQVKYIDSKTKNKLEKAINRASINTGISQRLILLLIKHESAFKQYAVSPVGARGLTQLMPSTASYFCGLKLKDIFRIEENISCGTSYLRKLLSDFNYNIELALAAYNSGPNRVRRLQKKYKIFNNFHAIENLLPSETKLYVSRIGGSYQKSV